MTGGTVIVQKRANHCLVSFCDKTHAPEVRPPPLPVSRKGHCGLYTTSPVRARLYSAVAARHQRGNKCARSQHVLLSSSNATAENTAQRETLSDRPKPCGRHRRATYLTLTRPLCNFQFQQEGCRFRTPASTPSPYNAARQFLDAAARRHAAATAFKLNLATSARESSPQK